MRALFISLIACVLASCSFNAAMQLQNEANAGLTAPANGAVLTVARDLRLVFTRGSAYHCALDSGVYEPIATGGLGTFYLAPDGRFAYRGGDGSSQVGGLLLRHDGSLEVWFFPEATSARQWAIAKSGIWRRDVKLGTAGMNSRPWVEPDFAVPSDAVQR